MTWKNSRGFRVQYGKLAFDINYPKFEPRDMWVGVYWKRERCAAGVPNALLGDTSPDVTVMETSIFICPLPCIVIKIVVYTGARLGW